MSIITKTSPLTLDVKSVSESGEFEGYASVFGERDQGGDIVEAGAFKASLKSRGVAGVKMLLDHDPRQRLGVWKSIEEDERGLKVSGQLFVEKQLGREALIDMKGGALTGLSIGFRTKSDAFDGRRRARVLKELDLLEISAVTFPMLESAQISAVKAAAKVTTIREFEDFLRDEGGFSNAQAKAIASSGFKAAEPRDEAGADLAANIRRLINTLKS